MNEQKNMEFVQMAMKYLPEAQEKLKEAGIELSWSWFSFYGSVFESDERSIWIREKRSLKRI